MKNERGSVTATDLIYEQDAYIKDFAATIIGIFENADGRVGIELDVTAFFPEGGGQSSDTGTISLIREAGDADKQACVHSEYNVVEVQNVDGKVLHYIEETKDNTCNIKLEIGQKVLCSLDFSTRFKKMQNHSGEHLLCGLIHNVYGYDNVGFHMDENQVTLDVNGELSLEELLEVEQRANEVICENVPIEIVYPTPEEAAGMDYRSKLELTEGVRIVNIRGYDSCACCAPHVRSTGEIGIVKVLEAFPHRGGTRIVLISGANALADYQKLDIATRGIMKLLSSKRYETLETIQQFYDKCQKLNQELIELKKSMTAGCIEGALKRLAAREPDDNSIFMIFSDTLDSVQMRNLVNECVLNSNVPVVGLCGNDSDGYNYIASKQSVNEGIELKEIANVLNRECNGRGGGSAKMVQGHVLGKRTEIEASMNSLC